MLDPRPSPRRALVLCATVLLSTAGCVSRDAPPPAAEPDLSLRVAVGQVRAGVVKRVEELIGGPTARGRVGDYKLYNSRVAFIVNKGGPASGFAPWGGKVVDADLVRGPGEGGRSAFGEWIVAVDQRVSSGEKVTVVSNGADGTPARLRVEGVDVSIPLLDVLLEGIVPLGPRNLWLTVDYLLAPDADALQVDFTVENRGTAAATFQMRQHGLVMGDGTQSWVPGPGFDMGPGGYPFFAALGSDVSYGLVDLSAPITMVVAYQAINLASQGSFSLEPTQRRSFRHFLAIGRGDTTSVVRALAAATGAAPATTRVDGRVTDDSGLGVPDVRVHALRKEGLGSESLAVARSDASGAYTLEVPAGDYELRGTSTSFPPTPALSATVGGATTTAPALRVPGTSLVTLLSIDGASAGGAALPAKFTVERLAQGDLPALSPMLGVAHYANGAARIVFSATGRESVRLQAGRYRITASRGFEYTLAAVELEVAAGQNSTQTFSLRRVVDTTGYLSGDFHLHAQRSPDSDDLDELKVAAFAAEGLEVPISTDHEHVSDYAPTIKRLGLEGWMRSIVGEEVTTFKLGHFNAFPLYRDEELPNGGAIAWHFKTGPEVFAAIRSNRANPILQINHPRATSFMGYFTAVGYDPLTKTVEKPIEWSPEFDAIEVINGKGVPGPTGGEFRDWYSFLNEGRRVTGNGNSDSHNSLQGDEVGYPRNYVRVPSDDLQSFSEAAFIEGVRRGRVVVSGRPFLNVSINGKGPGEDTTVTDGLVPIDVVVQAAPWMEVSDLYVVRNGEVVATRQLSGADAEPTNPVVRFRGRINVPSTEDGWYMVQVRGTRDMSPVVTGARPFAFSNPIYVDSDGDGRFTAPDQLLR